MPFKRSITTQRRLTAALGTLAAAALLPQLAHAQLATSPEPAQVPEVTVTVPAEAKPEPAAPRPVRAPAAAQQSSTPRAVAKPAPVAAAKPETKPTVKSQATAKTKPEPEAAPVVAEVPATPAAVDPATLAVAPTGRTQPIDQIGSSVTVITSQEIEAQQRRSAPELLRSVPGINVVQTGGAPWHAAVPSF